MHTYLQQRSCIGPLGLTVEALQVFEKPAQSSYLLALSLESVQKSALLGRLVHRSQELRAQSRKASQLFPEHKPAEANMSSYPSLSLSLHIPGFADQSLNVQDWIFGVDVLQEPIDQGRNAMFV